MAKIVVDIQNIQRSVLAMFYEDGSLAIECSYFANSLDETTLFHKLEISRGGVEVLRNMLVRDAQLRIGADEAGHTCPSCDGTGTSYPNGPEPEMCERCDGTGQV